MSGSLFLDGYEVQRPNTTPEKIWNESDELICQSLKRHTGTPPPFLNILFTLDYGTEKITHSVQINQSTNFGNIELIVGVWNGNSKMDIETNGESENIGKCYYQNSKEEIIEMIKTRK